MAFEVKECSDMQVVKELFIEYSHIQGAESCFVSFGDEVCEAKRLFIRPEVRGKGYARVMLNAMLGRARELGFKEVTFTTKPSVMEIGYGLYKRMGFEETAEKDGIVSMKMEL